MGAFAWLFFIVLPLIDALGKSGHSWRTGLTIAGAAAFVVLYVVVVMHWRPRARQGQPVGWELGVLLGGLYAIAVAMTVADDSGWGFLFVYCAAIVGVMTPGRPGLWGVLASTAIAAGSSWAGGGSGGTILGYSTSTAGIGLLMLGMRDLRLRNQELSRARAELARLAVAEERQRFARDLHDLLGHSLSVIALKAELAGRLLPVSAEDAGREIAELEQVARSALSEVREAVSGYRELTLDGELAGAQMALSAAGISTSAELGEVELPAAAEAVLAWAVREGATNVIRHSGARRCAFRLHPAGVAAELEVVDDGRGAASDGVLSIGGHGLRGLAERAAAVGGSVETGAGEMGGFRLAVRVPVTSPSANGSGRVANGSGRVANGSGRVANGSGRVANGGPPTTRSRS